MLRVYGLILIGLCLAICLSGCDVFENYFPPSESFTWIGDETVVGVIFPAQIAREQNMLFWLYADREVEGYWTPGIDDIGEMESRLPDYLRGVNDPRFINYVPIWENLHHYQRQYIGLIENGQRIIYANFFCTTPDEWDLTNFMMAMDGGDCFFQIQYDITQQTFYNLMVNGFA